MVQQAEKDDTTAIGLSGILSERTYEAVEGFYDSNEVIADSLVRLVVTDEFRTLAYDLSRFSGLPYKGEMDVLTGILLKRCRRADMGLES